MKKITATKLKSAADFKKLVRNGRIKMIMEIPFGNDTDPESLNGENDEIIYSIPGHECGILVDISYRLVGCKPSSAKTNNGFSGSLFIEADGDVSEVEWSEDYD